MQSIKFYCLYILASLYVLVNVHAQGFLKAQDKQIVNEKGENVLLRGIGLGGWMLQEGYMLGLNNKWQQQNQIRKHIEELIGKDRAQEFYDVWLANHTRKIDIDSLKAWGFNSVRLPMHYNLYTLPIEKEPVAGQQTWLDKGFAMTDSLLAWCKANKMYLILDLHAAPGGQGNDLNIADRDPAMPSLWENEANQQKMIALWKKLATRYAKEPFIGGYDIINEPNWGFADTASDKHGQKETGNAPLRKLMMDITQAIREVDKNHIIIIEGNAWGNNYNGILPAWDKNLVMSFHKYWNYNDQQSISRIIKYRDENNIPVWLGETGENSNTWFTDAIRLLEKNNIGWAWWPLKKLGFNNPLQIKTNHNYEALLAYWNGKRENPPKESDVYSGLIELATYTKFETNIIHRDVIDAMMRQPFSNATKPFKPNKMANGAMLNAVDFDLGVNGAAYFDKDTADYHTSTQQRTAGNRGRVYRNDGVDIRKDSALYESYYVSDIEEGEWLQFTIDAAQKGNYNLELMVASTNDSGRISILANNVSLADKVAVPNTGDMKKWQTLTVKNIPLNAGKQALRVYFYKGGFNFKSIRFVAVK
ncbi:MAG TPA: cellulase family glycosylhydrolase [Chitinophagaceae bacterium]|nr:cellulase family glycosylhydrolase [Chitinophagaceae bacterium]